MIQISPKAEASRRRRPFPSVSRPLRFPLCSGGDCRSPLSERGPPIIDDRTKGLPVKVDFKQGETDMGDKGSKDKGKKEAQKKAQRTPKEKRKLQKEKKNKNS
jgi:hypothetical protein